ncbi:MAG TPA: penicillin-binding protein activator [Lamprocystis sp. (in: g-proteobacteria)]|nr:penicillin-binding protein activator [Lamprocystis sp. (in: g-proteobacteria)]
MHQDRAVAPPLCCPSRWSPRALALMVIATLAVSGCAGLPSGQSKNLRGGYAAGDKVTAILPGTGPVADVANAVREGLRAAHNADNTAAKPTLNFIASEDPAKIAAAYGEAVKVGSTHVMGPLLKPAVDVLAAGPGLKVPTLALNQTTTPGKTTGNLYQFALAPESEGMAAANQAKAMGFTRALLLAPAGDADQRRVDGFRRQWKTLGGSLVGEATFAPTATDHEKTLNGLLGQGEADFLFLAADADQARRVYPAIRAAREALPVIATSAVYSGATDPARDKALTGLYFVDLPWVLGVGAADDPLARASLKRGPKYLATPLGLRLYAMGIDAYRLAPRLAVLAKDPRATVPGETGTLSLDAQGRVQRELTLAQFTASGPTPVSPPPATAQSRFNPFAKSKPVAQPTAPAPAAVATSPVTPVVAPAKSKAKPEPKRPSPEAVTKAG